MTSMADKIRKSSSAVESDNAVRGRESEREQSRSNPPTSYRLPQEILGQIEALRIAQAQRTGRVPTATEVIKALIQEAHEKAYK